MSRGRHNGVQLYRTRKCVVSRLIAFTFCGRVCVANVVRCVGMVGVSFTPVIWFRPNVRFMVLWVIDVVSVR